MGVLRRAFKAVLPYAFVLFYLERQANGWRTPEERREGKRWIADKGDETFRLDYDELNAGSVIFDLGGYKGEWTSNIFSKYLSNVYIFEPVKDYAAGIQRRFSHNHKIHIFSFGLADKNDESFIAVSDNASSLFYKNHDGGGGGTSPLTGDVKEKIQLVCFGDFVRKNNISHIHLMKINIEGGEYDLLDCIIASDFVKNIDNIQVQFHTFVPMADERRAKIQASLSKTHHLTYNYTFVWENWKRGQL